MGDEWQALDAEAAAGLEGYLHRLSEPMPLRPRSKQEWLQRRPVVRQRALEALGLAPMPDRIPLEPRLSEPREGEGFRVYRLYWQTWPKVWAGGRLFLPASTEGGIPALLAPVGADPDRVHALLASLSARGYACLAVDPPPAATDLSVGLTPATVAVLSSLRALDYLQAHEQVDRDRIAILGIGEDPPALYLLALDDRPKAGVLEGEVSYCPRSGAFHPPGIGRWTSQPELLGAFSPRALLLQSANPVAGEVLDLRAAYRLWGQGDRLAVSGGGEDQATELHRWLDRELRGLRESVELPGCPPTLPALPEAPPPERHLGEAGILDWFRKRAAAQPPQLEGKQARKNYQERARAGLVEVLGGAVPPAALAPVERGPVKTAWDADAYAVSLRSEAGVRVPALWVPAPGDGPRPVLLAVHPRGKAEALKSSLPHLLHAGGYSVLMPDVRFRGALRGGSTETALLYGRPEAGMAADDLRACVDWLWGREDVNPRELVLWGHGDQGVTALLAAGLDERITATVADCCHTTYRDGGPGLPIIPNILRVADVPQLASLVAPRPLWLYNVPGERTGFSSRRYYDWTRRSYQSLGELQALMMSTDEVPTAAQLLEWLPSRVRRANR